MSPKSKRRAVYPGTFDPITTGHHDLVRRASGIFDQVVIGIAPNPNKAPLFPLETRVDLARKVLADLPNVKVMGYSGLTVDLARDQDCGVVIRGLRAVSDFEFEFQLANMSRHLDRNVDYIFLTPHMGTNSAESVDFPDFAEKVGSAIQNGEAERGIIVCGSGVGACIAANKMKGVYASICHDTYSAAQGVMHDDMNVLCLGGRVVGVELTIVLIQAFLGAEYQGNKEGGERLARRVGKIHKLETEGRR